MKKIFCRAMALAVFWAFGANADDAAQEVFVAVEFSKAATRDIAAAQEKYVGKTVRMRGVVSRTYTSRYLTPCVELVSEGTKVTFVLPYGGVTRGMGQLSNFKAGQSVTMEGRIVAINEEVIVLKESRAVE